MLARESGSVRLNGWFLGWGWNAFISSLISDWIMLLAWRHQWRHEDINLRWNPAWDMNMTVYTPKARNLGEKVPKAFMERFYWYGLMFVSENLLFLRWKQYENPQRFLLFFATRLGLNRLLLPTINQFVHCFFVVHCEPPPLSWQKTPRNVSWKLYQLFSPSQKLFFGVTLQRLCFSDVKT